MTNDDRDAAERTIRVTRMMNDRLRTMTPQERDRTMQIHLAQARGPVRNAKLLCEMTAMLLRARQAAPTREQQNVHKPDR